MDTVSILAIFIAINTIIATIALVLAVMSLKPKQAKPIFMETKEEEDDLASELLRRNVIKNTYSDYEQAFKDILK